MRMWEIRENESVHPESKYSRVAKSDYYEEGYECGYEDGYKAAKKAFEEYRYNR